MYGGLYSPVYITKAVSRDRIALGLRNPRVFNVDNGEGFATEFVRLRRRVYFYVFVLAHDNTGSSVRVWMKPV